MLNSSFQTQKPAVFKWYVAYCLAMALLYLFVVVLGFIFLLTDPADLDMKPTEAKVMSIVFILMGVALLIPFIAGPMLPRRNWAWVVGIVLICIGMTSACCLPAAIPLLIFWMKPETKDYFRQ